MNRLTQHFQERWDAIPRDGNGQVDIEGAKVYLTELGHSGDIRDRSAFRAMAHNLGMSGPVVARYTRPTEENVAHLQNFIIEAILSGKEIASEALGKSPQPPPNTDAEERLRMMQMCRTKEQEVGTSLRDDDWWPTSTVAALQEYARELDVYAAPVQEEIPEPAPEPEPAAPVDVPSVTPDPAPVQEDPPLSEDAYYTESGYVIPVRVRDKTNMVVTLTNFASVPFRDADAVATSAVISKLIRGRGLNLAMPDGKNLPRSSAKVPLLEALYAHMYPYGHEDMYPERLGATDWAANNAYHNGRDNDSFYIPASHDPESVIVTVDDPEPVPETVQEPVHDNTPIEVQDAPVLSSDVADPNYIKSELEAVRSRIDDLIGKL